MLLLASVAAILLAGLLAQSGSAQARLPDLTQMSLEELTQFQVTSVSRKEQRAWKTGAAVYIITREDIRRSGAANIPDLLRMVNGGQAQNYGGEIAANWTVNSRWKISPGLTILRMKIQDQFNATPSLKTPGVDSSPAWQWGLRSLWNLRRNLDWDTAAYYVGGLAAGNGTGAIPAYARLDTRVGWRLGEAVEISVSGQNLLAPRHVEFRSSIEAESALAERSFLANITWRF